MKSNMEMKFDLVVIGAGPGGYVAAIRASQLGLKTAVVEKASVGGVCLNIGCIPSKNLIESAGKFASMKQLEAFGVQADMSGFNYGAVHAQSRKMTDVLSKGVQYLLGKNNITLIEDEARITGPNTVATKEGQVLETRFILVATGSRPRVIPGMEFDGERVLSSDHMLLCNTLPKSLLIIGGGAIGCEFAYIMRSFGVDVTLVEMMPQLLPYEDAEVAKALAMSFKKKGIAVHTSAKAAIEAKTADTVTVTVQPEKGEAKSVTVDKVLCVAGRVPNTEDLGLSELGIETARNGFIPVNAHYQTAVPSIYAIGDVLDTPMLAHVASKEGELAVEHMAGRAKQADFHRVIPSCVYCEPQVAGFGLTEARAKETDPDAQAFSLPFRVIGKAVATNKSEGFVKIVVDASGKVLGAHIIGADATEMIHELALAASAGIGVRHIAEMVHAHPTMSEAIMEVSRAIDGTVIHV
jgi:dihydrolipoamide dehydrogenase